MKNYYFSRVELEQLTRLKRLWNVSYQLLIGFLKLKIIFSWSVYYLQYFLFQVKAKGVNESIPGHIRVNETIQDYMKRMTGKYVSDFAYVPTSEMDFFGDMFEVLTEARVTVEIAYAKVFNALEWDRWVYSS